MKSLKSFTIGALVFIMSITPVFAASAFALGLASSLADIALNYYIGTQEQRSTALQQLNNYWRPTGGSGRDHSVEVSYDSLSSLVVDLNLNGFPCELKLVPGETNLYYIVGTGYVTVPGVIPTTTNNYNITNRVFHNTNGSLYPLVAYKYDSYSKLEQIRSQLVNLNNSITAISTKITNFSSNFDSYSSTVTTWLSNKSQEITNIANRLVVTRDGTQFAITTLVSWIYDSFYTTRSDTGRTGISAIVNWIYNDLSGTITTKLDAIQSNTSNTANRLVFTRTDGDYSIANLTSKIWDSVDGVESTLSTISSRVNTTNNRLSTIISNTANTANRLIFTRSDGDYSIAHLTSLSYDSIEALRQDGHVWVSTNSYSAPASNNVSSAIANEIISFINTECIGKQAYFWRSMNTYSSRPIIVSARIASGSRLILCTCINSSGSLIDYTLRSPDGNNYYVLEDTSSGVFDDSNIVAAIDRIYDWLDNADLATNSTIVQLVRDYSTDVNNAILHSNKILDLFGYSYTEVDNGFTNSDWADAKEYFAQYKG